MSDPKPCPPATGSKDQSKSSPVPERRRYTSPSVWIAENPGKSWVDYYNENDPEEVILDMALETLERHLKAKRKMDR